MFSILKNTVLIPLLFISANIFATLDFTDLTDLSTASSYIPQIATFDNYVYAIWELDNGTHHVIQTKYSTDYGQTWSGVQTISDTSYDAANPQIAAYGDNVYAVWYLDLTSSHYVICTKYSTDHGQTWHDPTTSEYSYGAPATYVLSDPTQNSKNPQISAYEDYVYVIWRNNNGTTTNIQTTLSSDNGQNWQNHQQLSTIASGVSEPQIIASENHVYGIWESTISAKSVIETKYSSDNGTTWQAPTSAPYTTYLSDTSKNAIGPQIAAYGNNICAVWEFEVTPSTIIVVQTAYSIDGGVNWLYPTTTPAGSPNLTSNASLGFAENPQIVSSENSFYAVWSKDDTIQTAYSHDSGITWSYPTTTPTGTIPTIGAIGNYPQIAAYEDLIYAVWEKDGEIIQAAYSYDDGINWYYPATTQYGTPPDIGQGSGVSFPQIAANNHLVYTIWSGVSDSTNYVIQFSKGSVFYPIYYQKFTKELLLQADRVVKFFWNPISYAQKYRIYNSQENLLYEGTNPYFYLHGVTTYPSIYYFSYFNSEGMESPYVEIDVE